jgi:hypothetical protein
MCFSISLKIILAVAAAATLSMVNGASALTISWQTNVIETAQLGCYSNGLGVTNNANDGSHTVDNSGYTDFVAFYFNQKNTIGRKR